MVKKKLQLAQWFIKEKNRLLFVFDLLKNPIFDRQTYQDLIEQFRSNHDLFLRHRRFVYGSNESNIISQKMSEWNKLKI